MIPFFPQQISHRAIAVYLVSLITVSLVYSSYAMSIGYMALGVICVVGFSLLTAVCSKRWRSLPGKTYLKHIILIALGLRLTWVLFSYFYYLHTTGIPFEFGAADSVGYHEEAAWLADSPWSTAWNWYFGEGSHGMADVGYPLYLTILYKLFGVSIIIPRLLKVILSTWTCVLVYRLSARYLGEQTGRMAAIMCALMPNLIIYCGYHLKETEMLFLEVAFLERTDFLLRTKEWNFTHILLPILLAGALFFFRTVLGAAAVFSFLTAILLTNTPSMKKGWKRVSIIGWGVLALAIVGGSTVMTEIESYWEEREDNVVGKRMEQTARGNQWAKYATGTVMAPMGFVLPFSTMVDVDQQYGQLEKHGGNFIRNFMGFFALIAIYEAIRKKKWRDFVLVGAFAIAYLGVVSLSGFSNSERFLLPGLPCLIIMWAYGVSTLTEKTWKGMTPWCIIVFFMELGWAYFKLGSRGLF